MTVDPDAAAFAAAYLADPTDDDTLDHHAARMAAGEEEDGMDSDAASLAYDLMEAEAHPAPDWRAYQEYVWGNPWIGGIRATVAWA